MIPGAAQQAMAQKAWGMVQASRQTAQALMNAYAQTTSSANTQTFTTWITPTISVSTTTISTVGNYLPQTLGAMQGISNPYIAPRTAPEPHIRLRDGDERTIHLPDGTVIKVAADGSFEIDDDKAQVIYRANRIRAFNAFLNASDKIEAFIAFCGQHGVRQNELFDLPIRLFIGWLVIEAAKADNEPEPQDVTLIPDLRKAGAPRCHSCRRFIAFAAKRAHIEFCGPRCFERHYARIANDRRS